MQCSFVLWSITTGKACQHWRVVWSPSWSTISMTCHGQWALHLREHVLMIENDLRFWLPLFFTGVDICNLNHANQKDHRQVDQVRMAPSYSMLTSLCLVLLVSLLLRYIAAQHWSDDDCRGSKFHVEWVNALPTTASLHVRLCLAVAVVAVPPPYYFIPIGTFCYWSGGFIMHAEYDNCASQNW